MGLAWRGPRQGDAGVEVNHDGAAGSGAGWPASSFYAECIRENGGSGIVRVETHPVDYHDIRKAVVPHKDAGRSRLT